MKTNIFFFAFLMLLSSLLMGQIADRLIIFEGVDNFNNDINQKTTLYSSDLFNYFGISTVEIIKPVKSIIIETTKSKNIKYYDGIINGLNEFEISLNSTQDKPLVVFNFIKGNGPNSTNISAILNRNQNNIVILSNDYYVSDLLDLFSLIEKPENIQVFSYDKGYIFSKNEPEEEEIYKFPEWPFIVNLGLTGFGSWWLWKEFLKEEVNGKVELTAVCMNTSLELDQSGTTFLTPELINGGSYGGVNPLVFQVTPLSFNCSQQGQQSGTLTVIDQEGNSSSCEANVMVYDNIPPQITCKDITVQLEDGSATFSINDLIASLSDNCGTSVTEPSGSVTYNSQGSYELAITAMDNTGNSSSCTAVATVLEEDKLTIECPMVDALNTDSGVCYATYTLPDPVTSGGTPPITITQNPLGNQFDLGPNVVTFTATDADGTIAECSVTVDVFDKEYPVINCKDITVQLENGSVTVSPNEVVASSSDNCGSPTIKPSESVTYTTAGSYEILLTATDASENSSSCTAVVTVEEEDFLTIECPVIDVLNTDPGVCYATHTLAQPTTEGGSGEIAITQDPAGNQFEVGQTEVTFIAVDEEGNMAECTVIVTVQDAENPVISCQNYNYFAGNLYCGAYVTIAEPQTSDNCGVVSVSNSLTGTENPSGNFDVGEHIIIWTVTDIHNHTDSCEMKVTVRDIVDPVINCPPDIIVDLEVGQTSTFVEIPVPDVFDNCGIQQFYCNCPNSPDASGTFEEGSYTVTWHATDVYNNMSSCSTLITINLADPCNVIINALATGNPTDTTYGWAEFEILGAAYPYTVYINGNPVAQGNSEFFFYDSFGPGVFEMWVVDANDCQSNVLILEFVMESGTYSLVYNGKDDLPNTGFLLTPKINYPSPWRAAVQKMILEGMDLTELPGIKTLQYQEMLPRVLEYSNFYPQFNTVETELFFPLKGPFQFAAAFVLIRSDNYYSLGRDQGKAPIMMHENLDGQMMSGQVLYYPSKTIKGLYLGLGIDYTRLLADLEYFYPVGNQQIGMDRLILDRFTGNFNLGYSYPILKFVVYDLRGTMGIGNLSKGLNVNNLGPVSINIGIKIDLMKFIY